MIDLMIGMKPRKLKKAMVIFYEKLNFSPKFRRETELQAKRIYLESGKSWNETILSKDADTGDRSLLISVSSFTASLLKLIKKIEEKNKFNTINKRRFSIFLHRSKKKVLIELRFFHTGEGKKLFAGLVIHENWGKENKPGGMRYGRRVSKSGYDLVDSGRYYRKLQGWFKTDFSFRGKKSRLDIKIKYWTRKLNSFYLINPQDFPFFK